MPDIVYEDIVHLEDSEIQMLLREVDTKDLALAMMGSSEEINKQYFSNVSDRVGHMLREEMAHLSASPGGNMTHVQSGIVETLKQLQGAGVVVWPKIG